MSEDSSPTDNGRRSSISNASTYEEMGEFWDTHSLAEYWDQTHEVEFENASVASAVVSELPASERGKYARRASDRTIMVTIDADLAEVFRNSEEVNRALRLIMGFGELAKSLDTRRAVSTSSEPSKLVLAESKSTYEANRPDEGE